MPPSARHAPVMQICHAGTPTHCNEELISLSHPAGNLPALERGTDISPGCGNEFVSARNAIHLAKSTMKDLDTSLSPAQRAVQLVRNLCFIDVSFAT